MVVAVLDRVEKVYPRGWLPGRPGTTALAGVTLELQAGEVVGLVGPNRAGKTTLVKILLSLSQPTAGRVFRFGRAASDRTTLGRVGYVHENHAFPKYLTARDVLAYYASLSFIPAEEIRPRAERLLAMVGLADRDREPIGRFSKGMLQRLGIAQALINDPDLLVLDEPGEGLDLQGREMIAQVVNNIRQCGGTVLLVSHQIDEVERLSDRIVVLVDGRIAYNGAKLELTRQGAHPLEEVLRNYYEQCN